MSDIKLFRIGQGIVSELSGTTDTIEKSLQTLFEKILKRRLVCAFWLANLPQAPAPGSTLWGLTRMAVR